MINDRPRARDNKSREGLSAKSLTARPRIVSINERRLRSPFRCSISKNRRTGNNNNKNKLKRISKVSDFRKLIERFHVLLQGSSRPGPTENSADVENILKVSVFSKSKSLIRDRDFITRYEAKLCLGRNRTKGKLEPRSISQFSRRYNGHLSRGHIAAVARPNRLTRFGFAVSAFVTAAREHNFAP